MSRWASLGPDTTRIGPNVYFLKLDTQLASLLPIFDPVSVGQSGSWIYFKYSSSFFIRSCDEFILCQAQVLADGKWQKSGKLKCNL